MIKTVNYKKLMRNLKKSCTSCTIHDIAPNYKAEYKGKKEEGVVGTSEHTK